MEGLTLFSGLASSFLICFSKHGGWLSDPELTKTLDQGHVPTFLDWRSLGVEDCSFTWETGVQDAQSTVMVTSISMLGQGRLYGVLQTVQIVKVAGYRVGVSPGVLLMSRE